MKMPKMAPSNNFANDLEGTVLTKLEEKGSKFAIDSAVFWWGAVLQSSYMIAAIRAGTMSCCLSLVFFFLGIIHPKLYYSMPPILRLTFVIREKTAVIRHSKFNRTEHIKKNRYNIVWILEVFACVPCKIICLTETHIYQQIMWWLICFKRDVILLIDWGDLQGCFEYGGIQLGWKMKVPQNFV